MCLKYSLMWCVVVCVHVYVCMYMRVYVCVWGEGGGGGVIRLGAHGGES